MAIKQIDYGSPEYESMLRLRYELLRKPLGLSFDPKELEKEKEDVLIGAFDEDRMLGCCLLTPTDPKTVRLRQMAVSNNLQGKGIGRALMIFAENIARDMGFNTLMMHSRATATGFYEKMGYVKKDGQFIEITIPHVIMEKKLR
jgi:N-acetylglutamate synthase-like GNAT family acetyltransferase